MPVIEGRHVFVSVGSTATDEQEAFVCAVEARLRAEGLTPHTVGRDTFSADSPLTAIKDLMKQCSGAVIIALERSYFPSGVDRPGGPKERALTDVRLATPWNQIEASMAYAFGLPLMVLVELEVRDEGLLEPGYDWYVQRFALTSESLASPQFNGVFASWKQKLQPVSSDSQKIPTKGDDPAQVSVGQLLGSLKPAQLWSVLAAVATLVAGAFFLGTHIVGGK